MTKLGDAWAEQYQAGMSSKQARAFKRGWEAAMRAAENVIIDAAPPLNAELSMQGGAGPFTDPGMAAYVEGFHDAWATVSALGNEHRELVTELANVRPEEDR